MPTVELMSLCSVVKPVDFSFSIQSVSVKSVFQVLYLRDETDEHNCLLSPYKNYSHNPKSLYDSPSFSVRCGPF